MPRNYDRRRYIREMEELNEVRSEFRALRDNEDMHDEDEDEIDKMLDLHLKIVKSK
jgi:hypothetical protein